MKTIYVALAAWVIGAALGVVLCHASIKYLRRRVKNLKRQLKDAEKTMDKMLKTGVRAIIAYTVVDFVVFCHVGSEPSTLTACFFGFWGFENGVMGWIKTNKDKINGTSGTGPGAAEPPEHREEPPDVGA